MATLLYLTDLYYKANGRAYYMEDLFITERLKPHFNLLIGHPQQVMAYAIIADVIVFRNTGPVIYYQEYFNRFLQLVKERGLVTFNSFDGKADIRGKQYLLELTAEGYPVISTTNNLHTLDKLGNTDRYMVKLVAGADSIGMEVLSKEELYKADLEGKIIQPFLSFEYEVSFYYLNNRFQYAMYAPDKNRRWNLEEYRATREDLAFADTFVQWDQVAHGIVRIDACRLPDGSLRLVEIEDLNPFLSIDLLPRDKREQFMDNLVEALSALVLL